MGRDSVNLRTIKRKTQAAMAAAVVVELRVPVGMTAFTVLRIVQSMTRNRIRGALRRNVRIERPGTCPLE